MEPTKEPGVSAYFASFRRRSWLTVGVGLPILAATVVLVLALPDYYSSLAVFRFEASALQPVGNNPDADRNNYLDAYVSKLQDTVLGPASLTRLRDALHLPATGDGDLETLNKQIRVTMTTERILDPESGRQKDTNSGFTVRYQSRSPQKAQQASQWLADEFIRQSRQNRHDRAMQAATFLDAEADKYRTTISVLESKLADFKQQHVGELPESANATEAEKERAEQDLSNDEQQLIALRQNHILLQSQLAQTQAVNPNNDTLRQLQDEYNKKLATYDVNHPDMIALKQQIDALQRGGGVAGGDSLQMQLEMQRTILAQTRQRYSEDHPDVKRLERSIAELQARIASGEKSTPTDTALTNPVASQLQTQLNANDSQIGSLEARRTRLDAKLATIAGQMTASPQIAKQYDALNRDVALARDKYDELQKRKMEEEVTASGALAGSGDEFRLLQPPGEAVPFFNMKAAIGIIGIFLSVILALGAAMIAEAFDQSVRGSGDLMDILQLAPLAVVPEIRNSRYQIAHRRRIVRLALSVLIGVPLMYVAIHFAVA
jgi:polysaccharide biosynthesis transport protein